MKIGDKVKIRYCNSIPELVGENAEIVDLQMVEFDKYRIYPIWAKITSGKYANKIYGFKSGEVGMELKVITH